MKIKTLSMENFRPFYGTHVLHFATDGNQNTTMIFGSNGTGKTTLLNAFIWGFYGILTADVEGQDRLINERAKAEAKIGDLIRTRIVIDFEHEGRSYTVARAISERKTGERNFQREGGNELSLEFIGEDGRRDAPSNPQESMDRILPKRLHNFFFFNGERIEALAKESAYGEVGEAIRNVLGTEIIERSIKHLEGAVRKEFTAELRAVGSVEIQAAVDAETTLQEELTRMTSELEQKRANIMGWTAALEEVNEKLRHSEITRELQRERERYEEGVQEANEAIQTTYAEVARLVSTRGFLAFTESACSACATLLQEKREKGEIPTGIKRQFVADLLTHGTCICGNKLDLGSPSYESLSNWRERAGSDEIEETSLRVAAKLGDFGQRRQELFEALDTHLARLSNQQERKRQLDEKISEIKHALGGKDSEEARELEGTRDSLQTRIAEENYALGSRESEIRMKQKALREQQEKTSRLQAASRSAQTAQRRLKVCDEAIALFKEIYDTLAKEVRVRLDERVRSIYGSISFKPYTAHLTEDFHLRLTNSVGGYELPVSRSTGENQILSLSFIGGIAAIARDRYLSQQGQSAGEQILSFRGGIYPVVMDSSFGNLDYEYQAQIATAIPDLAPQTIILVSKAQGMGHVKEKISPRTGRYYVISFHTPRDVTPETITINGHEALYIGPSPNEFEYAEIKEIR
jgi:DNA sulfur modification protein DndD